MPLAEALSDVYGILTKKEKVDNSRRKREQQESLANLFSSGRAVDEGLIKDAYAISPEVGKSLQKAYSGERLTEAKIGEVEARRGQRGAGALAGMAKQFLDNWNTNVPDEQKTLLNWRRGFLPARAAAIRSGIATPDMLPEDLGPQDLEGVVGLGYSPAQQDLSQYRDEEADARQDRFAQSQVAQQGRFETSLGERRRSTAAADKRAAAPRGGSGGTKEYAFDRKMRAAGIEPGTPDYIKAARIEANLDEAPGGGSGGVEMSYDAEGRPVISVGGKGAKLTEQQAKNATNATAAEQAQAEMDAVRKSGFDPSSLGGAAQVFGADIPGIRNLVSDEAQTQASANRNLSAALNYARSGANITELELENTQKALLDRQGDKPDVTAYKRQARLALIDSMKAGSPNVRAIVDDILMKSAASSGSTQSRSAQGRPAAGGSVDPERAELDQLRAMKAARSAGVR